MMASSCRCQNRRSARRRCNVTQFLLSDATVQATLTESVSRWLGNITCLEPVRNKSSSGHAVAARVVCLRQLPSDMRPLG